MGQKTVKGKKNIEEEKMSTIQVEKKQKSLFQTVTEKFKKKLLGGGPGADRSKFLAQLKANAKEKEVRRTKEKAESFTTSNQTKKTKGLNIDPKNSTIDEVCQAKKDTDISQNIDHNLPDLEDIYQSCAENDNDKNVSNIDNSENLHTQSEAENETNSLSEASKLFNIDIVPTLLVQENLEKIHLRNQTGTIDQNACYRNASLVLCLFNTVLRGICNKTTTIEHMYESLILNSTYKLKKLLLRGKTFSDGEGPDTTSPGQQDASEFLRFLFQALMDEDKEIENKLSLFYQQNKQCLECKNETEIILNEVIFPVSITKEKNLAKLFIQNIDDSHVENLDCDSCKKRTESKVSFKEIINPMPKTLCLQIKRATYEMSKNKQHFQETKIIRLPHSSTEYKLQSFIVHDGPSMNAGHYTAFFEDKGNFYYFDDLMKPNKILIDEPHFYERSSEAYILMYNMHEKKVNSNLHTFIC